MTLKGETTRAQRLLQEQPWVAQVDTIHKNGAVVQDGTHWQVSVNDPQIAERELFRLLARDESLVVLEYGRKSVELEEIFVQLVEGGPAWRQT